MAINKDYNFNLQIQNFTEIKNQLDELFAPVMEIALNTSGGIGGQSTRNVYNVIQNFSTTVNNASKTIRGMDSSASDWMLQVRRGVPLINAFSATIAKGDTSFGGFLQAVTGSSIAMQSLGRLFGPAGSIAMMGVQLASSFAKSIDEAEKEARARASLVITVEEYNEQYKTYLSQLGQLASSTAFSLAPSKDPLLGIEANNKLKEQIEGLIENKAHLDAYNTSLRKLNDSSASAADKIDNLFVQDLLNMNPKQAAELRQKRLGILGEENRLAALNLKYSADSSLTEQERIDILKQLRDATKDRLAVERINYAIAQHENEIANDAERKRVEAENEALEQFRKRKREIQGETEETSKFEQKLAEINGDEIKLRQLRFESYRKEFDTNRAKQLIEAEDLALARKEVEQRSQELQSQNQSTSGSFGVEGLWDSLLRNNTMSMTDVKSDRVLGVNEQQLQVLRQIQQNTRTSSAGVL